MIKNPAQGALLGKDIYKIRLAVRSKGKGKSEGARVITFINLEKSKILLLSIYNKGEKDNISETEIRFLIEK